MKLRKIYQYFYGFLGLILLFSILQTVFAGSLSVTHGSNLKELEQQLIEKQFIKQDLIAQLSNQLAILKIKEEAINQGYIEITAPITISE